MPNRILREGIITSPRMIRLSWPAEVFYRRLMSVVDDYGRYHAHPMLLRAACYPMQLDKVSDSDVGKWLGETRKAALVRVYESRGAAYLELLDFRQQVRAKASKYPQPPADAEQMPSECAADAQQMPADAHLDVVEGGDVVDRTPLSGKPDVAPQKINGSAHYTDAEDVLIYLNKSTGKGFEFRNRSGELTASADKIIQRLKQGYTREELREVVHAKCEQWAHDDKMAEYLRPTTLFGKEKFEQYLGELRRG